MKHNNLSIWVATFFLCAFGSIMVFSASSFICATSMKYNNDLSYLFRRQLIFMSAGLVACFVVQFLRYRFLYKKAILIYIAGILTIFLLKTPLGVEVNGATRWVRIAGVQFQVAEVVKLCVIVYLAWMVRNFNKYLSKTKLTYYMWGAGGLAAIILAIVSNDLSSSLVVLFITYGITWVYTKTVKLHLSVAGVAVLGATLYVLKIRSNLPTASELQEVSFRVGRIAAWLAPERYQSDQSYQTLQALYAIGRGSWFGQGLGNSIQKISAIPEAQNDMIFSIICEELGLVGAIMLIYLFAYLLYYLAKVALSAKDVFGSVLVTGIFMHIAVQVIINMAVNVNLLPNTGLALPFISYGGTAVFFQLVEIAIVLSIARESMGLPMIEVNKKGFHIVRNQG